MSLREGILGMLSEGPMTGYEIKRFFRDIIRNFWNVSDGQLYPTLRKMHEEGLVDKRVVEQEYTANKNVYTITDRGRERFDRWLGEPVVKFEELKEPFVMKLFFFHRLSKARVLRHLREQYDLHARILEEFRHMRDTYEDRVTAYQRLIGDVGVLYIEVRLIWIGRLIELVEQGRVSKRRALYTEEMLDVGKKFFNEIFSDDPSPEFTRWVEATRKRAEEEAPDTEQRRDTGQRE